MTNYLRKKASDAWKLYYFEGRNTGIAARTEEEARGKKKRGGDKIVAVRTPTDPELKQMERGEWVRNRADGKPPGKSEVEGRGMGPPLKEKAASISSYLRAARNKTHTHPTPAQARAGNYAKGELELHGIKIKLENPKGTERRGYDKDGNITWRRTMTADYGYFKGTEAIDGDAVDCFIGDHPESHFVAAIDQENSDGSFDETKFVLGCNTQEQAEKVYLSNYPRGWRLGPVSTTTTQQLKNWLKEGDTMKPFKGQMVKAANADELQAIIETYDDKKNLVKYDNDRRGELAAGSLAAYFMNRRKKKNKKYDNRKHKHR